MNCILKHIIEGKIEERREVTEIRGIRCKQLLIDEGDETRRYWKLKDGSHSAENSLWKRLWTCRNCVMMIVNRLLHVLFIHIGPGKALLSVEVELNLPIFLKIFILQHVCM